MTEIEIKNYQSIGHASITVNGFTVIVGSNNIGKSAVVRAIKGALTNEQGSDFIRIGQKETEVSFKRPDLDMVWKKGASASYKINGQTFTKLKGAIPPPLLEVGFQEFEVNGEKITPLIADQFNELFLLDRPGSFITDALSSMYSLDVLGDADELCQKDARAAKTQIKTREGDLNNVDKQLAKFDNLNTIKQDVIRLVELESKCDTLRLEIENIQGLQKRLQETSASVKRLQEISKIKIPNPKSCQDAFDNYEWIGERAYTLLAHERTIKRLRRTISEISVPNISSIPVMIEEVSKLKTWSKQFKDAASLMKKSKNCLSVIIKLPEYKTAENAARSLEEIRNFYHQLKIIVDAVKSSRESLTTIESQLELHIKEKEAFKVCPLCERPFHEGHT